VLVVVRGAVGFLFLTQKVMYTVL